ncbi:MAG: hypothetical protein ABI652_07005 [Acidobacteriota bacterium]
MLGVASAPASIGPPLKWAGGKRWHDINPHLITFYRWLKRGLTFDLPMRNDEEAYRSLGYEVDFLAAPRRISCNGDRRPVREIVAMRNL